MAFWLPCERACVLLIVVSLLFQKATVKIKYVCCLINLVPHPPLHPSIY